MGFGIEGTGFGETGETSETWVLVASIAKAIRHSVVKMVNDLAWRAWRKSCSPKKLEFGENGLDEREGRAKTGRVGRPADVLTRCPP
jgi:hypothetical protein